MKFSYCIIILKILGKDLKYACFSLPTYIFSLNIWNIWHSSIAGHCEIDPWANCFKNYSFKIELIKAEGSSMEFFTFVNKDIDYCHLYS